ncbi:hypothetical protein, partial [Xylella fastidiosa]|uniref:hypothetical protein n=1 Tax=Xylella fastidiosa TaxID=2371 RepID=UPI001930FF17
VQGSSSAISGQLTEDVRKHNLRNPGKEVVFLNVGGEALELTGDDPCTRICTPSAAAARKRSDAPTGPPWLSNSTSSSG